MRKIHRSLHQAIVATLLSTSLLADTIVLKTGERIDGRVVKETEKDLTLEVKVSASILDERIVPRAEVASIEKASPELQAYKAIMRIQPGASSLPADDYDPLTRALRGFIRTYPEASQTADVKKALADLDAEQKRVVAGDVKLRGVWMNKAEVDREKVQLSGQIAFDHMKAQSAGGDSIGALNTFAAIEKNYPGAAAFPDAVDLAEDILRKLKPVVEQAILSQKVMKAEAEAGFAASKPVDRAEMMAAYKQQQAAAEASVESATKANQWPPFVKTNQKCLTTLSDKINKETDRLGKLPTAQMQKAIALTGTGRQKMLSGDNDGAIETLNAAIKLWPTYELATRLSKEATRIKAEPTRNAAPPPPAPEPVAAPPKKAKPSAAVTPSSPITPVSSSAVLAERSEKTPFFRTLPGAITVVVGTATVLAGANIFYKIRARHSAVS